MICKGSRQSIKLKLTTSNFLNSLKCWAVTKSGVVNWNICSIIFSILIPIQWAFSSHPCAANCTFWTSGVNLLILKLTVLKHSHFIQHNYNLTFPLFSAMIHWTPFKCTQRICISMFSSLFIAKLWNVLFPVGFNFWRAESCPSPSWSHTFLETFLMGKNRSAQQWKNDVE